jgi:hypothetical protein
MHRDGGAAAELRGVGRARLFVGPLMVPVLICMTKRFMNRLAAACYVVVVVLVVIVGNSIRSHTKLVAVMSHH